jgi:mannitol/fructose-specific phosphotransferase system IIA component (Ntr-type)
MMYAEELGDTGRGEEAFLPHTESELPGR